MQTPRSVATAVAVLSLAVVVGACLPAAVGPAATAVPATSGAASVPAAGSPAATDAPDSSPSGSATATAGSVGSGAASGCTAPATPTIAETEGPYYKAGAPESADLVTAGMPGTILTLEGAVVDTACAPIAGARVETWQADSTGTYDNAGYTLRGWVTTDADGRFTIRTIVPGEYPGRTEHIHVKITPPGGATLTTQLYFPGTAANDADGIYDPSLLLAIGEDGDALVGGYTFVIGG